MYNYKVTVNYGVVYYDKIFTRYHECITFVYGLPNYARREIRILDKQDNLVAVKPQGHTKITYIRGG